MSKARKIVIFGASGGAEKVAGTFDNLRIPFLFFVDNDSRKWGTEWRQKRIEAPTALREDSYDIVIASDYQNEIEEQLQNMQISYSLLQKEEVILEALQKQNDAFFKLKNEYQEKKDRKIIFELIDAGICLGGIESWTLLLVRAFLERGEKVELITRNIGTDTPNDIRSIVKGYDISYDRYGESVLQIAQELVTNLPCTVVTNWQSQVMIAAIKVKELFPDKIKIFSVLHNDKITLYRRQSFLEPYTDKIMGVSQKINRTLVKEYKVPTDKIFYKESPVMFQAGLMKTYTLTREKPIELGYAARITKYQKRADLLVKLIEKMDERKIPYRLSIAGEGNYFKALQSWYRQYEHQEKVRLLGKLPRAAMEEFWKDKDVFLSISDFEGASISMLEAMAQGVVPVVTKVSGVGEFVTDDWNGNTVEVSDVLRLAECIESLEQHREKLAVFGNRARKIIEEKCNKEEYCEALLKEIEHLWEKKV